jgi:predicted DNA-binding protein (MmcQ/YjbR family)
MKAERLDPYLTPRAEAAARRAAQARRTLPEVSEDKQFGAPVWKAGKRAFAYLYQDYERADRWVIAFWCGIPQQGMLTTDPRYRIPKYMGHQGWISLDVTKHADWDEIRALALQSYRHFALKRMLAKLPED